MSFTDQKPRVVTEKHYPGNWGGYKDGTLFRCYLCGHFFQPGDTFRWVRAAQMNFVVCADCDGPDVQARWAARIKEYEDMLEKCWWANPEDQRRLTPREEA